MKLRIVALALAVAFLAAPALAAIGATCPPCADQSDTGPCSSLATISCCANAAAPAAPAKITLDAPTVHAVSGAGSVAPTPAYALVPRAAHELAGQTSPLRLSVVRRL